MKSATTKPASPSTRLPGNLQELKDSGWVSRTVKNEIRGNLVERLKSGETPFDGIVGFENTVIPEIQIAILAGHDILFLGEKGQAKSRLMRSIANLLDPFLPFLDLPGTPFHEDPYRPLSRSAREFVASHDDREIPVAWWARAERYAERLAPGTRFADLIGEIDPAKLVGGVSMSAEEALHFGLIPRMHRGIFAMNELPELDEQVQVGLFNVLEERDVQIRGYPVKFGIDTMVLFSANPSTFNRSGKVIPQLKDRIGSLVQTHYPLDRELGIEIMEQQAGLDLQGTHPVVVPLFMKEICEQITVSARKSRFVDHQSGVSARFSAANYRTLVSSARQRGILLGESPAVPRISDLGHLYTSSLGKLELDLMGTHQMGERQVLDAVIAEAIRIVFDEYVTRNGLEEITGMFSRGVRLEVGDLVPSDRYETIVRHVPEIWDKAFEVNASSDPAVRASCVEFVLAGMYAREMISRSQTHGRVNYET